MAETLGRFREFAGAVPRQPGDIALDELFIDLADGIALALEPSSIVYSGTKIELDTARCISCVV
jgi:hypothetical protein